VETTAANSSTVFDEEDLFRIGLSGLAQMAGSKLRIRADNASWREVGKGQDVLSADLCVNKSAGLYWERESRGGERSSLTQNLA
jgi:hypothetical protein